ncbi:hypothetical protein D3C84_1045080 [compost metagenome]
MLRRFMMIGNDYLYPQLCSISDLVNRTDSGIHRNNKRNALLHCPIQRMIMKPVAFIGAVRDINIE